FSSDQYKRMYIAHMRTIINEYFSNNQYHTRAIQLQQLIDASVAIDPNLFFPYATFQSNINSTIGNNIGLTELMDARVSYLQSTPEFTAIPPAVSVLNSSAVLPHTTINITANIQNANYMYLGYRFKFSNKFEKLEMFDDGNHGDGVSGDGVYGSTINVDARDVQYYIYAENNDAGVFSPKRAEKEFHQLAVVSGLVINEIMAANLTENTDQNGEYDDWVELYNAGSTSINLEGFYQEESQDLNNQTFSSDNNIPHASNIRVYPNPSNSKIYILGTNQKVEVYNMIGELVYGPSNSTTIDISDWKSGIYFVKSGLSVVKIIKH
ncbi:MAG: T9SS type A sorting domain-containing protein, partial [Flavobacteriales bacterium]